MISRVGQALAAPQIDNAAVRAPTARRHRPVVLGNQATLRRLQAKRSVGAVDDPLEHEADRVADQVMSTPDPVKAPSGRQAAVRRKCAACQDDDTRDVRLKGDAGPQAGGVAPASVDQVLNSPGQPLDAKTRAFFEPRFGADFSQVRVHTDGLAGESARAVNALAYASGQHIVLGAGVGAGPSRLLAHELAHVVQQDGAPIAGAPPSSVVQRETAPALPEDLPCATIPPEFKQGTRVRFGKDSDQPLPGQDALFASMAAEANEASVYQLHGNASDEGAGPYNVALSCRRVLAVKDRLASGGVKTVPALFAHGGTTLYGDEEIDNRNVVLVTTKGPPPKAEDEPKKEPPPKQDDEPKVPDKPAYKTDGGCAALDVKAIIDPGNARARQMLDNVMSVINKDPPPKSLNLEYLNYFAVQKPNLPAIRNTYSRLISIFNGGNYTYDCRYNCGKGEYGVTMCNTAVDICYGDIHLCMNNIKSLSDPVMGAATVMIHEMAHRKLSFLTDSYCNSGPDNCTGCTGMLMDEEALKNPDSYACFAQVAWNQFR